MRIHLSLSNRAARACALILIVAAYALPTLAADLPLATGSPLAGFTFDDQPLSLPVQQNFQMALLTTSTELGRSCGKMEAYGWRMKQSEQGRVDQIFNSTVDRLRGIGFVVETQTPNSISKDVTLFTADRPDQHFLFMWSAGEIGLVMVLCQTSAPMNGKIGGMPHVKTFPKAGDVVTSDLKSAMDKETNEHFAHFSPVGKWVGTYSCAQGQTGGTLDIAGMSGKNFNGTFKFYATKKNPREPSGSYHISGQYDRASHRALINPGKWIKRPKGYANTIIVGDFDPASKSFSGYFQGITGCTSFEAKLTGSQKATGKVAAKKAKKKKTAVTPAAATPPAAATAPLAPAPAAASKPAPSVTGGPPSPGIAVGAPATPPAPPAPAPAAAAPAPTPPPPPAPAAPSSTGAAFVPPPAAQPAPPAAAAPSPMVPPAQ